MTLVMGHAVNRVPSRTLLWGAAVTLILGSAASAHFWRQPEDTVARTRQGERSRGTAHASVWTYRAPTALYRMSCSTIPLSFAGSFGVAILPAAGWRLPSAMLLASRTPCALSPMVPQARCGRGIQAKKSGKGATRKGCAQRRERYMKGKLAALSCKLTRCDGPAKGSGKLDVDAWVASARAGVAFQLPAPAVLHCPFTHSTRHLTINCNK